MSPRTEASIHPSNSGEDMYPSISENDNMYPSIPEKDYMYPSIPENDCFSSLELKFIDSTLVRADGEAKVPLGTAHSGQSRVREETGNFSCVQEKRRDASRVSRSSRSYPTDCVVKSSTTASGHVRLRLKNSSKRRPMLPKSEVVKNNLMEKVPGILEGTVFWKKNRIQFKDSGDVKGIWFGVEETQEAALLVTAMQDKAVTASELPKTVVDCSTQSDPYFGIEEAIQTEAIPLPPPAKIVIFVEKEVKHSPMDSLFKNGELTPFGCEMLLMEIEWEWKCKTVTKIECYEQDLEKVALKRLARFENLGFSSEDLLQQIKTYTLEGNREGRCWLPVNVINEIEIYIIWLQIIQVYSLQLDERREYAFYTSEDSVSSEEEHEVDSHSAKEFALNVEEDSKESRVLRTRITKLNGENYAVWKIKMQLVLDDQKLWNEKLDKPMEGRRSWKEIMFAIEDNQFVHCETLMCGLKAWDMLANQHEKTGIHTKLSTMNILFKMRYESGTMDEYCSKIVSTSRKLARLGVKFDEEIIIGVILQGLPEKYQAVIHAWDAVGDVLKLEDVISKLNNMSLEETPSHIALTTVDRKCFACGKGGHFKRDCPNNSKKQSNYKQKKKNGKESANTAQTETKDYGLVLRETQDLGRDWILDSGATRHMCNNELLLTQVAEIKPFKVYVANGKYLLATKVGTVKVQGTEVKEVYFVKGLSANLLAVSHLAKMYQITFVNDKCTVTNGKGQTVFRSVNQNNVYRVNAYLAAEGARVVSVGQAHEMLGHLNIKTLKEMVEKRNIGFQVSMESSDDSPCEVCIAAKLTRCRIPKTSKNIYSKVGELIYSDVWGPAQTLSFDKCCYFVTFIDAYSGYVVVVLLKHKSGVFNAMKSYVEMVKTQLGISIQAIRSDNGGEYNSKEIACFCEEKGIKRQFTHAYSSFENGVAERANRTLVEGTRCLLISSQLIKSYWSIAVVHMAYLRNIIPTKQDGSIPYELFFGKKPDYKLLYTFGEKVWVHIPKEKRKKLDRVAYEGVYVGIDKNRNGIRVLRKESDTIVVTRDFRIIGKREKWVSNEGSNDSESENEELVYLKENHHGIENEDKEPEEEFFDPKEEWEESVQENETGEKQMTGYLEDVGADLDIGNILPEGTRRTNVVKRYHDMAMATSVNMSAKQALKDSSWKEAMDNEMESQKKNKTWELVTLEKSKVKPLGCKWVFTIKEDAEGKRRYKARLVVGGHRQKYGIDYNETFSPVVKHNTIRILLALATKNNLEVHQMDFVTAFLNGYVEEEIFMKQPEGYEDGTSRVCKLVKSLYGLKQAPRQWNLKLHRSMVELGFQQLKMDSSVYIRVNLIVAVYVDDCILVSPKLKEIEWFKKKIQSYIWLRTLGNLR